MRLTTDFVTADVVWVGIGIHSASTTLGFSLYFAIVLSNLIYSNICVSMLTLS